MQMHPARPCPLIRPARAAFTLVELLVVISVVALLIALLIPALSIAREAANMTVCLANERQQVLAMASYQADNEDFFCPGWSFINRLSLYERLEPYGQAQVHNQAQQGDTSKGGDTIWMCPSDPMSDTLNGNPTWRLDNGYLHLGHNVAYRVSYAVHVWDDWVFPSTDPPYGLYRITDGIPRNAKEVLHPSKTLMFTDGSMVRRETYWWKTQYDMPIDLDPFHLNRDVVNIVAVDGHAETFADLLPTAPPFNRSPYRLPEHWYRLDQ